MTRLAEPVLRELVDATPDALVVVNAQGIIVLCNRQANVAFGYKAQELEGKPIEILVPVTMRERHATLRQGYAAAPKARPMGSGLALSAVRKDRSEFPVEIMLAPLADGYVAAVVRDITGRGPADEQQAEIRRLKDIAEFRARFLNVAAHELKTPLTPIRLQMQILKTTIKDPTPGVTKSLEILSRSVERLHSLMEDVLDAARVQANRLKVRQEVISLSDVIRESVENYDAVAKGVGITFRSSIESDVRVTGDAERILQVATNLLSNAMKFTTPGGSVDVTLTSDGKWATLTVKDTGRGMDATQLGKLFEPFSQVHLDTQATLKGTGLGLYISKAIIQQHGGDIGLSSPGPGLGSSALVRLPTTTQSTTPRPARAKASNFNQRLREMV